MTRIDSKTRSEKRSYDGRPITDGMLPVPVWLPRKFVNESDGIRAECLTTWTFAGIRFLIGFASVKPEKYDPLKKECYKQINEYLEDRRSGRCIIGYRRDGTPRLCPRENRCTGCVHWGEYERCSAAMRRKESYIADLPSEPCCEDVYFAEDEDEGKRLEELVEHLAKIDCRYPDIVRMLLGRKSKKVIFETLGIGTSQGYKLISDCRDAAASFFGVGYRKKFENFR